MKSRRNFLQEATALTIGGALLSHTSWAESFSRTKKLPDTGIQLFTILMQMEMDAAGSLQKLAAAGYKNCLLSKFDASDEYSVVHLCSPLILKTKHIIY